MRHIVKFVFLLVSLFVVSCNFGKELTDESRVPHSNETITIDGILDEKSWSNALVLDNFKMFLSHENSNPPLTKVKLFQSKTGLYIAAQIFTEKISAFEKERDGQVYKDNCFELFLDPDSDGLNYYELEINAFATIWDLILKSSTNGPLNHPSNMLEWDLPQRNVAVHIEGSLNDNSDTDQYWLAEVFIPWHLFTNGKPKKNEIWKANFMRIDYVNGEPSISVWKKTKGKNIHRPAEWGVIVF